MGYGFYKIQNCKNNVRQTHNHIQIYKPHGMVMRTIVHQIKNAQGRFFILNFRPESAKPVSGKSNPDSVCCCVRR